MGLSVVTPVATEPVTRTEAKLFCRIDASADDDLVDSLITAARQHCEGVTRRAFAATTYDYTLPYFPCGAIELPVMPVTSVTSVSYVTEAGETALFNYDTSPITPKYDVFTDGPRTLIEPKYNETWPATRDTRHAVTVRFVAGYTTLPKDLKQAMYLLISHWYDIREPVIIGASAVEVPMSVEAILSGYQMRGF